MHDETPSEEALREVLEKHREAARRRVQRRSTIDGFKRRLFERRNWASFTPPPLDDSTGEEGGSSQARPLPRPRPRRRRP